MVIWNSRMSDASRHQNTWGLPLEQRPNPHQPGENQDISQLCKTCHFKFIGNTVCTRNSAFKNTALSASLSPSRWCQFDAVQFHTFCLPHKVAGAFSRPGVEATTILATKITQWHGNTDCVCSRFKIKIAFMKNIGCQGTRLVAQCVNWDQ